MSAFVGAAIARFGEGATAAYVGAATATLRSLLTAGARAVSGTKRAVLLIAALGCAEIAAVMASDAAAATISPNAARPWTRPGTHPCRDLCGAGWALDRMRSVMPPEVHAELARRIDTGAAASDYMVATGDEIRAMSYAKGGAPFVDFARREAQFSSGVEYPARGHFVAHDGALYRFVRIAACGNWALLVEQGGAGTPEGFAWSAFDRSILEGDLGDIIIGGAGNDSLAPASEDLPIEIGASAAPGRRASGNYFPVGGNGPVAQRYADFGGSFGGGFGGASGGGFGGRDFDAGRSALLAATFGDGPVGSEFGGPSHRGTGGGAPGGSPGRAPDGGPGGSPGDAPGDGPGGGIPGGGGETVPPYPPPPEFGGGEPPPAPIPLPGTLALVAAWLAALGGIRLWRG